MFRNFWTWKGTCAPLKGLRIYFIGTPPKFAVGAFTGFLVANQSREPFKEGSGIHLRDYCGSTTPSMSLNGEPKGPRSPGCAGINFQLRLELLSTKSVRGKRGSTGKQSKAYE